MVNDRRSDLHRKAQILYLPSKFLRPFSTQYKGKSTIHYLLERRNLERKDIYFNGNVKNIRLLGVIYPSGRIVYKKVVKVKVGQYQVKFVAYHN